MKKTLLFGIACGFAMSAAAQESAPIILPEFNTMNISFDGRYIGSNDGGEYTKMYDREDGGEPIIYDGAVLGNGNAIALNGMAVGSTMTDRPVIMYNGEVTYPSVFDSYNLASLHGITADGTRVCGLVSNQNSGGAMDEEMQMYFPIYADIVDGEVGELQFLPIPEKDFFGTVPQYCSAVWISNDGKTILGQIVSNTGMLIVPIVYKQDEAGEWSYSLPTESLFNTENNPLPVYPGEFELESPDYYDYMTDEQKAAYEEALNEYYESGYTLPRPELSDYMTEEAIMAYNAAVEEYNKAADEYNEKLDIYFEQFWAVMDCSANFQQNAQTMNAAGTEVAGAAIVSEMIDEFTPGERYVTYIFNLEDGSYRIVTPEMKYIIPGQILADGTIMAYFVPGYQDTIPPHSYVLAPGADEYVLIEKYLAGISPVNAEWMEDSLSLEVVLGYDEENNREPIYGTYVMSGYAMASDDMNVISGGVMAYLFNDEERYPYSYMSYVLSDISTGVADIAADSVAVKALRNGRLLVNGNVESIKVYDLSGRQVFAVSNASGLVDTKLGNGLYVVTYVDAEGRNVASKVRF